VNILSVAEDESTERDDKPEPTPAREPDEDDGSRRDTDEIIKRYERDQKQR